MPKESAAGSWEKIKGAIKLQSLPRGVRCVLIGVIGGTVLLIGIAMMVLPGPAFVVIPLGLMILATEFAWARWGLNWAKKMFAKAKARVKRRPVRAER